jgi:hypothetical protein
MAYIGRSPTPGEVIVLNSIESQFNGVLTTFNLTRTTGGVTSDFYPVSSAHLFVSLGGVIQEPDATGNTGFRINYNTIIFAVAPLANTSCFIVCYGNVLDIGTPADGTVTSQKIAPPGPTWDSTGNTTINATGYLKISAGTTGDRPGTPVAGMIRYNSTNQQFEGYGTAWGGFGGASGASGNAVFYENDTSVTASYTITSNKNAMTAGPITINNGVVVTVPTGSSWTVV